MAGYKFWADLEVLTHTDVNGYLMAQAVPRFLSAEARDEILVTPAEGQLCWVVDLGVQVYDGADWVDLVASQLTSASLTTVSVVATQAAQLALTAESGDVAVRSDLNKSYIRNAGTAGTMADWTELLTPTDLVLSVAGRTGAVVLVKADVGLGSVDNTADTAKPVSTAQAAADLLRVLKAGDTMTGLLDLAAGAANVGGLRIGTDVNLYRLQANILKTDDALVVAAGIFSTGTIYLGPADDVNLYRSAADVLATDDKIHILRSASGASFQINNANASGDGIRVLLNTDTNSALKVSVDGDAGGDRFNMLTNGTMRWGSGAAAWDTNLYRSAADVLKTDDSLVVAGLLDLAAGAANVGGLRIGTDVNLYRSAANVLATDDRIDAGGGLKVIGNVGFYGTAIQAKPTVTGSRTDGTALTSLLTALATLGLITDSSTA